MITANEIYEHYRTKGHYRIVGIARNSEDHVQELVIYQNIETGEMWARPRVMFEENVEVDGRLQPRFRRME